MMEKRRIKFTKLYKIIYWAVVFLSSSYVSWAQEERLEEYEQKMLHQIAPAFETTTLPGETVALSSLKGDYVIVLNFWFMGCGPCLREFGKLNELTDRFKDKPVIFLAISIDEDLETMKIFLRRKPLKYKAIGNARHIADAYGVKFYPTNLVIDSEGKISFIKTAYHEDIDIQLSKAIQEALSALDD